MRTQMMIESSWGLRSPSFNQRHPHTAPGSSQPAVSSRCAGPAGAGILVPFECMSPPSSSPVYSYLLYQPPPPSSLSPSPVSSPPRPPPLRVFLPHWIADSCHCGACADCRRREVRLRNSAAQLVGCTPAPAPALRRRWKGSAKFLWKSLEK